MHIIVYKSEYCGTEDKITEVTDEIVRSAKKNNPACDVTGALFYHSGLFFQIIEGPQEALEALMSKIEKDERHKNIERLFDDPIRKRAFQEWNMDFFNLDDATRINSDELRNIAAAYKKIVEPRADLLLKFYHKMLSLGSLR